MSKLYKSDYVDSNGVVYPTIGENIRKGAKENQKTNITIQDVLSTLTNEKNITALTERIVVDANTLREAIKDTLLGNRIHFGGLDVDALSDLELKSIYDNLSSKNGAS